ncbi:MAG: PilZ domain-containing protein [Pyrinomonadaceae bacterium]
MPRKEDRYTYLKEVELEFSSGKRSARITDISAGGCYIDTIAQVRVGDIVSLPIFVASGVSMIFSGKVAYVLEGFGFGVEFLDLTDEQRDFLARLLASTAG